MPGNELLSADQGRVGCRGRRAAGWRVWGTSWCRRGRASRQRTWRRAMASSRDESPLAAIEAQRDREAEQGGRSARGHGRPTIAMPTSVRLPVLEDRSGGGDETLLRGGGGDGGRAFPAADRQGAAGDALPGAGGQDRLDRGRGRHRLPERCRAGGRRGADAEFGSLEQLAEVTVNTKPGRRGFILPSAPVLGNPGESESLPRDGGGAPAARPVAAGRSPRRRLADESHGGGTRPARPRAGGDRRACLARLDADAAAARPRPRRRRGPDLAAETPPRAPAQPPERRRGRAHRDWLGAVRRQRRDYGLST